MTVNAILKMAAAAAVAIILANQIPAIGSFVGRGA